MSPPVDPQIQYFPVCDSEAEEARHLALIRVIEPLEQRDEGGLPGTAEAHERQQLAGLHGEADALQRWRLLARRVAVPRALHLHLHPDMNSVPTSQWY